MSGAATDLRAALAVQVCLVMEISSGCGIRETGEYHDQNDLSVMRITDSPLDLLAYSPA